MKKGILIGILTMSTLGFASSANAADDTGTLFYVSNDHSTGIALRAAPDEEAELLLRMPYLTVFLAEDYEGSWVYTTYEDCSGWTHLDYSTELGEISLNDYYAGNYDLEDYGDLYYVSNKYPKGIALRSMPNEDSKLHCRLPYLRKFLVTDYEGEWAYTSFDGKEGWLNLNDISEVDEAYYEKDPVIYPEDLGNCTYDGKWYAISTDYEPGIAIHPIPDPDSETLGRISYQDEFFVEYTYVTADNSVYGFTEYDGCSGWINVGKHAVVTEHMESIVLPEQSSAEAVLTEQLAYDAVYAYLDSNYDLDMVYEYHGYIIFADQEADNYVIYFRSYTGAHAYYYVNKYSGDVWAAWESPVDVQEYGEREYAFYAYDYL